LQSKNVPKVLDCGMVLDCKYAKKENNIMAYRSVKSKFYL